MSKLHRRVAGLLLVALAIGIWELMPAATAPKWDRVLGTPTRLAPAKTGCMSCHVNALDERFSSQSIAAVNQSRIGRALPEIQLSRVLLAHPRLDLLAGMNSPHSRVSCVSCHEGSDETSVNGQPHPAMISLAYVQSNCLTCHRNGYDIADAAPQLSEGRREFTALGCVDCHKSDVVNDYERRKVGPDLRHLDAKISKAFVADWLMDPTRFRPSTAMPRVIREGDPDARQEVEAITEYLFASADKKPADSHPQTFPEGDYARGRILFEGDGAEGPRAVGLGCVACHTNLNDWNSAADREPWIVVDLMKRQKLSKADALIRYTAMTYNEKQAYAMTMTEPTFIHFGPELSRVGEQLTKGRDRESARQWLFAWLKDPKQYHADTLMPNLRLSDQEASDLAAYLIEQKAAPGVERGTGALTSNPRSFSEKIALGAKLISHYGCMNCHEIGGPPLTQPALDLSNWGQKPLDQLDFTRLDASHRTRQDWLIQHLNNPASVSTADAYDQPRMPFFHLTLEQAQNLAVFVLGNREVDGAIEAGKKSLARGRALTVLHNCVGCHQVETNTPLIQQYFKLGWISTFAPPQLRGEGNRVQYAWLRNFFTHVTPLRPLLGVRMPTFNFRPEEPEDLISFFHAASDKESADLRRMIVLGQTPNLDDWALLHKLAVPIDLNPAYCNRAQIEETQRNVQFEAEFTANLYDTAFLEKELPTSISEDRFKLGERFLQTAQCLACHLMSGDGSGDLTKAKAPNLDLTAERLQKKWVKALLEAPEVVLHGTNMPRYFTGEAGIASNSAVRAVMQLFGKSAQEQTNLLIDFLYAAGPRHYTTVADPHLNAFH